MINRFCRIFISLLLLFPAALFAQVLPTSLSGLKLWLDASDVNNNGSNPANGTTVATWRDKSGNNNNATIYAGQSGGAFYSNQINGKAVVRFTRSSQYLGSVYEVAGVDIRAVTSPAVTIFTVYKQGAQSGDQALWGNDNGGWDRFYFTSWSSNTSAGANNGGASLGPTYMGAIVNGAGIPGITRLLTAVYNNNVANGSAIYFNGQTVTNFTDQTNATAAQTNLRIGFDGDDNCYNGDIAEVIIYNRVLTACEIQQINRYLGGKYGVVFSSVSINAGGATTFYQGGSVVLTASTTGTAYQWYLNGNPIAGATSQSYTATASGDYTVAVTNTCVDTSPALTVTVNTMPAPGHALNFDGVNDYVDCGNNATLAATNIKTMETWVKFNNLSVAQEILSKSIVGSGIELLLYNNTLSFYCMNGTNVSLISYPASNLKTGIWYHLAATWNGTKESMRLYVNGEPVGTRSDLGNINGTGVADPAGSTFKIGQWSAAGENRYFNGSIDEVRIWNTARTQSDIQSNMYNVVNPASTGLIAYYRFDHGTAAGSNAAVTSLYDFSGNGRNGTLANFALSGTASNWVESYAMVVPALQTAQTIHATGFTANWTAPAVGIVTNYLLDVSSDPSFASYLTGYNGLNVGNVTSYPVSGLVFGNTYYYRVRANKTSVAGQAAWSKSLSITTTNALPVTLLHFAGKRQADGVLLTWNTAAESNSKFFSVERSSNGTRFTEIGQVKAGAGLSASNVYSFTDPVLTAVAYYRLKIVDKDGSATYSKIVQVNQETVMLSISITPNPARDVITVKGLSGKAATLQLLDVHGRVLLQQTTTGLQASLSIVNQPNGTYYLRISDAGNVCTRSILKQ